MIYYLKVICSYEPCMQQIHFNRCVKERGDKMINKEKVECALAQFGKDLSDKKDAIIEMLEGGVSEKELAEKLGVESVVQQSPERTVCRYRGRSIQAGSFL